MFIRNRAVSVLMMLLTGAAALTFGCTEKDKNYREVDELIRINQVGFYPEAPKKAIIVSGSAEQEFSIVETKTQNVVFKGISSSSVFWPLAGQDVTIIDFSELITPGEYYVAIGKTLKSFDFEIGSEVMKGAFFASIKGLYYQRAGMKLEKEYAGKWNRTAGHLDNEVIYHPSSGRDGYAVSSKGWYDAGDFNKYVVNGSFALAHLYQLAEHYPNAVADADLNLPESGNGVSDLLDEARYEMDWLLTMQDIDGGLFHKLTTKRFSGMVMPGDGKKQRYIVGKGTGATLDFAACAALAARVHASDDPTYAKTCQAAAIRAWTYATAHPNQEYINPEDVVTGQYGDKNFDDEFFWAAAELYVTTGEEQYLNFVLSNSPTKTYRSGDTWTGFMRYLGVFSLLQKDDLPTQIKSNLSAYLIAEANVQMENVVSNDYFQPLQDFQWGSVSDQLSVCMIMARAYEINKDERLLNATKETVDYVFGKNAIGHSLLTGHGDKWPMYIHHRQSAADEITEPVPGLISGGPNMDRQDAHEVSNYPDNEFPMQSWTDEEGSYASNEICLNWNTPLSYVLGFLEAIH